MVIPNTGEDTEKLDPSYVAGGNVKWYNHSGKTREFLIEATAFMNFRRIMLCKKKKKKPITKSIYAV